MMRVLLTDIEVRVMGVLVEKARTTPEYYPLTLNALVAGCNQKSNRDPVVAYDDALASAALDSLRGKSLVLKVTGAGERVPKYRQYFAEAFGLSPAQEAVICELMLRGAQTAGELRNRAERMHHFAHLAEVEEVVEALLTAAEGPLVARLPRQAGQKEVRYAHLLTGEVSIPDLPAVPDDQLGRLEVEVAALRQELDALRTEFLAFKSQLE